MRKKLNAGVIGVGRMGQYHVNVYSEMRETHLAGIMDPDEERTRPIAEKLGTRYFRDMDELLKHVDVVSVAVPTLQHYEVTKRALAAGKHVLVEKPMTHSMAKARELFRLAHKKGVVLQVGHLERFNGAVQELKKIVDNPIFIESHRIGPYDDRIQDDGVVLDLMIHDIDIILNLIDSPVKSINAMGCSVFSDREDLANIQIRFGNGCLASITASRTSQVKERTLSVTMKDKFILLDYTNQDIHIHRRAHSEHELSPTQLKYKQESFVERIFVHKENPLKLELQHLVECVNNGTRPKESIDDALKSLQLALDVLDLLKGNLSDLRSV